MLRGWQTTGTAACRLLQDADLPSRQKFFFPPSAISNQTTARVIVKKKKEQVLKFPVSFQTVPV